MVQRYKSRLGCGERCLCTKWRRRGPYPLILKRDECVSTWQMPARCCKMVQNRWQLLSKQVDRNWLNGAVGIVITRRGGPCTLKVFMPSCRNMKHATFDSLSQPRGYSVMCLLHTQRYRASQVHHSPHMWCSRANIMHT